jgi:hypothetical protein
MKMLISTMTDRAPGVRKCKEGSVHPFNLKRTATAEQKQAPKNAAGSGKRGLQRQHHCRNARDDGMQPSLIEDDTQTLLARPREKGENKKEGQGHRCEENTLWRKETTTVTGFSGCPVAGQQPRSTAQFTWTLINANNECNNKIIN